MPTFALKNYARSRTRPILADYPDDLNAAGG